MNVQVKNIVIPEVSQSRINNKVLKKIEIMVSSVSAVSNISEVEYQIADKYKLSVATQRRLKSELRKLFLLPKRSSLIPIAYHPQLRKALEYAIVRKEPSDKGTLRSGKKLVITFDGLTNTIPLEQFIFTTYLQEGLNATAVFRTLTNLCKKGYILSLPEKNVCHENDLPSLASVRRYLRKKLSKETYNNSIDKNKDDEFINFRSLDKRFEHDTRGIIDSIVQCCKEIHKGLGHKHREVIYHRAVEKELKLRSIPFVHEAEYEINYKGSVIGKDRVDFLVGMEIIIELKAKKNFLPEDIEQAKRYLSLLNRKLCLLINFGGRKLQVKRFGTIP